MTLIAFQKSLVYLKDFLCKFSKKHTLPQSISP